MIDTIRLAYPLDNALKSALERYQTDIYRVSPSGEVIGQSTKLDTYDIPSSFSGLWWGFRDIKTKFLGIDTFKEYFFFELSLQKFFSPSRYSDKNWSMYHALCASIYFIGLLSDLLHYNFDIDKMVVWRVDLAQNFLFKSSDCSVYEFLENLDYKMSSRKDERTPARYRSSLYFSSRWITKKLYVKFDDYKNICKKNRWPVQLDLLKSCENVLRLELEFHSSALKDKEVMKIMDIPKLMIDFEEERKKFLSARLNAVQKVKMIADKSLSDSECRLIELVRELGYTRAREVFYRDWSRSKFFRVQKKLRDRGIYLELCDASIRRETKELNYEILDVEFLKEFRQVCI